MSGESGGAAGGHDGMMVNQTVLNLAEETPRPRRTRTLMTQQQFASTSPARGPSTPSMRGSSNGEDVSQFL